MSRTRPSGRAAALAVALLMAGCSRAVTPPAAPPEPAAVEGPRALNEVQAFLQVGPRDAGTPGAEKAAAYLQLRLRQLGVEAAIDTFTNDAPGGPTVFRNVIGRRPGSGRGLIVVGCHYDTKTGIPGFVGANDSGSGTGVLLELARVLAARPPLAAEIQLVFFDGEECRVNYGPADGLHGSRHPADRLVREGRARDVLGVIVLDMIGDRGLSVTVPRNGAAHLISGAFDAARAEGARDMFSLHPFAVGDDHQPFLEAGLPAVDLIDFEFGSAPGRNDYWHTDQDTLDKLSADSLQIAGRVTLRLVAALLTPAPP